MPKPPRPPPRRLFAVLAVDRWARSWIGVFSGRRRRGGLALRVRCAGKQRAADGTQRGPSVLELRKISVVLVAEAMRLVEIASGGVDLKLAGLERVRPGTECVPPDRRLLAIAVALSWDVGQVSPGCIGADHVAMIAPAARWPDGADEASGLGLVPGLPEAAILLLRQPDIGIRRTIRFGVHHDCTGQAGNRQVVAFHEFLYLRKPGGDEKFCGVERDLPGIGKPRLVLHHLKIALDGFKLSRLRADHLPARNQLTADVGGSIRRVPVDKDAMVENVPVVPQPPRQQIGFVEKMRYDDAHGVRSPWDSGGPARALSK